MELFMNVFPNECLVNNEIIFLKVLSLCASQPTNWEQPSLEVAGNVEQC